MRSGKHIFDLCNQMQSTHIYVHRATYNRIADLVIHTYYLSLSAKSII